jgi:glycosyltransferase involved in cell wall biosynthesis
MDHAPPFVSVIVPVLNDEHRLGGCIEALLAQTYPKERYEVIVVDNGSTDRSYAVAARYPITLLSETKTRSSFAARNKGMGEAVGEVFAFTDSDCTPEPHWLEEGVRALEAGADLAGGRVRFVFSVRPSGAEVCDSMANMQIERNIRERGVCKTANLFVRADVFASVGPFPHDLPSGGDVIWTGRATTAGHRLVYSPRAEVAHPTRRLRALLKKHYRVGRGQRAIRAEQRATALPDTAAGPASARQRGKLAKLTRALRGFLPEPLSSVRESMRRHQVEGMVGLHRVWVVAWLCRAATTLGSLAATLQGQGRSRRAYATE